MAETTTKAKKPATKAKKVAKMAPEAEAKAAPKRASKAVGGAQAVFMTGGKQYRVKAGENLKIEKLLGEHKEGDTLTFDKVLLVDGGNDSVTIGTPYIAGASISATLKKIGRYKTVEVIKYKQKSRYFKKNGHRQPYFEVTIDSIK